MDRGRPSGQAAQASRRARTNPTKPPQCKVLPLKLGGAGGRKLGRTPTMRDSQLKAAPSQR